MYLSPEYAKFQKEEDSDMKRGWVLGLIGIIGLAMFGTADNVFQFERVGGRAWRYGHHTESGEAFQESDLSDGGSGLPYRSRRTIPVFASI